MDKITAEQALDAFLPALRHLFGSRNGTATGSIELRRHARRLETGNPDWGEVLELLADGLNAYEKYLGIDHDAAVYAKGREAYHKALGERACEAIEPAKGE